MNLCDSGHDEVCFEGKGCPCCFEMEQLKEQMKELAADRDAFEAELNTLKSDFRAIAREMAEANKELARESIE